MKSDPTTMKRILEATPEQPLRCVLGVSFIPATYDAQTDTVRVLLYSRGFERPARNPADPYGDRVIETFSLEPGAMRPLRSATGVPLLKNHEWDNFEAWIGKCEDIQVTERGIEATLRFGSRPEDQWIKRDVQSGIIDRLSMGALVFRYRLEQREEGQPALLTWIDWELAEGSFTPVQADPGANTLSAETTDRNNLPAPPEEQKTMSTKSAPKDDEKNTEPTDEAKKLAAKMLKQRRADEKEIEGLASVKTLGLNAAELLDEHETVDAVKLHVLGELEKKQPKIGGAHSGTSTFELGEEQDEKQSRLLTASMTLRLLGKKPRDAAETLEELEVKPDDSELRQLSRMSLEDYGLTLLEQRGVDTRKLMRGKSRIERAKLLMGASEISGARTLANTGDLSILVGAAMRVFTKAKYKERPSYWEQLCHKENLEDFEEHKAIGGGYYPDLEELEEEDSYTLGSTSESEFKVKLKKAGRLYLVSWEMVLADKWGRIAQLAQDRVNACIRHKNRQWRKMIKANKMSDGVTDIFSVGHANIGAVVGLIGTTQLAGGLKVMARQKGEEPGEGEVDDRDYLNTKPKYLVAGIDDTAAASVLLGPGFTPTSSSGVPTDAMKRLRDGLVEEPFLDDMTPPQAILVADPEELISFQRGYLEGEEGPQLFEEDGFTEDGKKYKVRYSHYVECVDHKGVALIKRS